MLHRAPRAVDDRGPAGSTPGQTTILVKAIRPFEELFGEASRTAPAWPARPRASEVLCYGDLSLDLGSREVRRAGSRDRAHSHGSSFSSSSSCGTRGRVLTRPRDLCERLGLRLRSGLEIRSNVLHRLTCVGKTEAQRRESPYSNRSEASATFLRE